MADDSLKCGPACLGGERCSNSRIYISNLPKKITPEEIVEHFAGIGVVARERPRGRGVYLARRRCGWTPNSCADAESSA